MTKSDQIKILNNKLGIKISNDDEAIREIREHKRFNLRRFSLRRFNSTRFNSKKFKYKKFFC